MTISHLQISTPPRNQRLTGASLSESHPPASKFLIGTFKISEFDSSSSKQSRRKISNGYRIVFGGRTEHPISTATYPSRPRESSTMPDGNHGHATVSIARRSARIASRNRRAARHPAQLLCASLRFRDCRGAHLLCAAPDRPRGNHRQAARHHRRGHLFRRASHRLSARAFRIRPRKYQPPIRLVVPSRAPFLQFRAAEPALRAPRPRASLRSAKWPPRRIRNLARPSAQFTNAQSRAPGITTAS